MATVKRFPTEDLALTKQAGKSEPSTRQSLSALAPTEKQKLELCEEIIRTKLVAFLEVGRALLAIRQLKLYREHFTTFEAYCQQRWAFNRSHAYRLVDAAKVCAQMSPMGDIRFPENERQVRPLRGLPPEIAKEAWKRAVEKAGKKPITGALVKMAAAEVRGQGEIRQKERQDWQFRIEPLLKEALHLLKRGEKTALDGVIQRISLLLLVGEGNHQEQQ
jgi:hypothetical protein